jgi:6-phosphogluconolactonase
MSIKFRGFIVLLALFTITLFLMSCGSSSRPAGLLFVTNQGNSALDSYGINLTNGVLTQINTQAPTPSGTVPGPILLDAAGAFAYVANTPAANATTTAGSLSAYAVNSNGSLQSAGSNPATGILPVGLAMDPGGHFLFVANQGSNNISVFSIGSSASLTAVAGSPFASGVPPTPLSPATATPTSVAVDGSGKFVYVANQGQNTLSGFNLDTSTGALTAVPGSPFAAGTAPTGVTAVTTASNGAVVYVANEGSNNVSAFTINTDGSLTEITGSPFAAGLAPVSLAVDPSKNFLYVADLNSNEVSGYRINVGSGALTATNPATVSTGARPVALAFHPQGHFLYVANISSDSISGFQLTPQTGALVALPSATTPSNPAGIAVK